MDEVNETHPIIHTSPPSSDHDAPINQPEENQVIPISTPTTSTATATATATIPHPVVSTRGRRSGAGTYFMPEKINF